MSISSRRLFDGANEELGILPLEATAASNDLTGTVSGSTATSGTVVGSKGAFGVVSGSTTTSGTVVGSLGYSGTVSGSTTTSGTVVGSKGAFGVVSGSTTTSGTVVGSGGDVEAPPTTSGGGGSDFAPPGRDRNLRRPRPKRIERHGGRVHGHTTTSGYAHGTGRHVDSEDELLLLALI